MQEMSVNVTGTLIFKLDTITIYSNLHKTVNVKQEEHLLVVLLFIYAVQLTVLS